MKIIMILVIIFWILIVEIVMRYVGDSDETIVIVMEVIVVLEGLLVYMSYNQSVGYTLMTLFM